MPDLINQIAGQAMTRPRLRPAYERVCATVLSAYQHRLHRWIRQHAQPGDVFHYRAGFSGSRVLKLARARGMHLLCDHSIAHPQVLNSLTKGQGLEIQPKDALGPFWGRVMEDIDAADHVLVNSHFVRDTFARAGADLSRLSVVYTLPEDDFTVPGSRLSDDSDSLRVLFAGTLNERKGLVELEKVIRASAKTVHFTVAGQADVQVAPIVESLARRTNVDVVGVRPRNELAQLMARSDVFLFPTRAEGSARVVAEAMHSRCAVLTTPEAGSLLPRGDWQLSESGDWLSMCQKLHQLDIDRPLASSLAETNAGVIEAYREQSYGERLREVYARFEQG